MVGQQTADLGTFDGTFQEKKYKISYVTHKMPTIGSSDGTKTIITKTADLGSFNGTFQLGGTSCKHKADFDSFDCTFHGRNKINTTFRSSKF